MYLKRWAWTAAFVAMPGLASAAIISDGNVSLGVDTLGQLNVGGGVADVSGTTAVGTRWIDPSTDIQYESTSHGCLCEGWGLAVDGTVGFANNDSGSGGLTAISDTATATTAQTVTGSTGTDVVVTHDFQLSASDDLYEAIVTIENTGTTDVAALEYRRVMDWDASPTPFDEYVTIGGTATTTLLSGSSNNGFASSNPLAAIFETGAGGCGITTDFTACGPADHGALFDFALGGLAAGETFTFSIFYGGAANETEARAALGTVGAEVFSFGWSADDADQDGFADIGGAVTPTFIFAFKGVGGTPVEPNPIPLPASGLMLLGAGLGVAALRRMKKRRQA